VWDELHGQPGKTPLRDVDLVYFDSQDLSDSLGKLAEATLAALQLEAEWDIVNQAGVHLWYKDLFGSAAEPVYSSEGGIDTWPETATCIGVRLLKNDELQIYAPYGLDDLFGLILRRNKKRVSLERFRQRHVEKRIREKWPLVTIIDG